MSDMNLRFLPWLRRGLARSAQANQGQGNAALNVSFKVGGALVSQTLRLRGPGDVVGISSAQILRVEPEPGTRDFEPNYFPCLELVTPDLPWMFTPTAPDANKLLPWVTLITVTASSASIAPRTDAPLPILTVPTSELPPDLNEMWAWAHIQTTNQYAPDELTEALADDPDAFISRLISPRNLAANTEYFACLVPTYQAGVLAGLGIPVSADVGQTLAWQPNPPPGSIDLPVYYSWTFATSETGDFEMLVERLQAAELNETVGRHLMDISDMGVPISAQKGSKPLPKSTYYFGSLVSPTAIADAPKEDRDALRDALYEVLTPALPNESDGYDYLQDDPVVTPAHYGHEQLSGAPLPPPMPAGERTTLPYQPVWYGDVNTHPRTRGAAGLGMRIVRRNQEAFMARAWEEVTALRAVNQTLQQATFALLVSQTWQSRVTALDSGTLLSITRSAHTRILPDSSQRTIWSEIKHSAAPNGTVSLEMQRILRTGGAVHHALRLVDAQSPATQIFREQMIFNAEAWRGLSMHTLPVGAQVLDETSDDNSSDGRPDWYAGTLAVETGVLNSSIDKVLTREDAPIIRANSSVLTLNQLASGHIREVDALVARGAVQSPQMRSTRVAAERLETATNAFIASAEAGNAPSRNQLRVIREQSADFAAALDAWILAGTTFELPTAEADLSLEPIAGDLRTALDAESSISAHLQSRITFVDGSWGARPVPSQFTASPVFTDAVYRYICDISSDLLLPGLGDIPNNTVGLVEVNAENVESVLLGINHEMSREMRWREYPAALNSTWFQHFWSETQPDIKPVNTWSAKALLGHNLVGAASSGSLVLLIKGDILTRYPNLAVYAVPAVVKQVSGRDVRVPAEPEVPVYPAFTGELEKGVKFYGFEGLTQETALGDGTNANAGYFFALQEQPTEPRFGLDEYVPGTDYDPASLTTWDELSWGHLMTDENPDAPPYAIIAGAFAQSSPPALTPAWGSDSAAMARIILQRPVRMLVHASRMLPGVT